MRNRLSLNDRYVTRWKATNEVLMVVRSSYPCYHCYQLSLAMLHYETFAKRFILIREIEQYREQSAKSLGSSCFL